MNRYKIVRFIGRGGMGAVYLCDDLRLSGRQWALKEMILSGPGADEQIQDSFQREARFLASLRHRALPVIVDIFSSSGRNYLVMEYIQGDTLAKYIESKGIPSDTITLSWALELAQVLDYLHRQERPIIFRDLKPENIIITDDGHIKLIDFGLARQFEPGKSRDTQASGTIGYAPPEQWEDSKQSDPRSDIYSLAATIYFILTGKAPSPVYGTNQIRTYRPGIEPAIEALVIRGLQIDPDKRYQKASEVIKDILLLLSQDKHQRALEKAQPQIPLITPDELARTRSVSRIKALRPPLAYPQKLNYLLIASIILWLIGCSIPFLNFKFTQSTDQQNASDSIIEVLQATETGKSQAREFLKLKQYDQAIALLDELNTKYPIDAELLILKNNAYAAISGQPPLSIPVLSTVKGVERDGFQLLYGYALAQLELNKARLGQKPLISLELYDDQSNSERLLEITRKLTADPNVPLILGPYYSQAARLITPIINANKVPTISPTASDPQLFSSGNYLLSASDTDTQKVQAIAQMLRKKGYRRAAVFSNDSSILSRSLSSGFISTFEDEGGQVVCSNTYPTNQLEFTKQVLEAKELQADCVFLAEYRTQPVIGFCKTIKALDYKVAIAAQTPGYTENLIRSGKQDVEGLYLSTYYIPDSTTPKNKDFSSKFHQIFAGLSPSHREAQAYDALKLAVQAIDTVGTDHQKLISYLRSIGQQNPPYSGVSGSFALTKSLSLRKAHILQIVNGKYEQIT